MNVYEVNRMQFIARTKEDAVLQYRYQRQLKVEKAPEEAGHCYQYVGLKRLPLWQLKDPEVTFLGSLGDFPPPLNAIPQEYVDQLNAGIAKTRDAYVVPLKKRPTHGEIIFPIGDKEFIIFDDKYNAGWGSRYPKFTSGYVGEWNPNNGDGYEIDPDAPLVGSSERSSPLLCRVDREKKRIFLVADFRTLKLDFCSDREDEVMEKLMRVFS